MCNFSPYISYLLIPIKLIICITYDKYKFWDSENENCQFYSNIFQIMNEIVVIVDKIFKKRIKVDISLTCNIKLYLRTINLKNEQAN